MENNNLLLHGSNQHVLAELQTIHDSSQWDVSLQLPSSTHSHELHEKKDNPSVEIVKNIEGEDHEQLKLEDNRNTITADYLKTSETKLKSFFNKISEGTYIIKDSKNGPNKNIREGNSKQIKITNTNNYVLLAAEAGDFEMLDLFLKITKNQIKVNITKNDGANIDLSTDRENGMGIIDPAKIIFGFKELSENRQNILHLILNKHSAGQSNS